MHERKQLEPSLHLAAVALFVSALVAIPAVRLSTAMALVDKPLGHWRSGERTLTVVDRTGDPAWEQASRWAVARWNEAGADVHLRWSSGNGVCVPGGTRIGVCGRSYASLQRIGFTDVQGIQGIANPDLETAVEHNQGGVVEVCSDCPIDEVRRQVIATHEIGHTLGLLHTNRRTSVMYHAGSPRPDAGDYAALRSLYAHDDPPADCGVFNLHLGNLCL